jgi:hypothetical protein
MGATASMSSMDNLSMLSKIGDEHKIGFKRYYTNFLDLDLDLDTRGNSTIQSWISYNRNEDNDLIELEVTSETQLVKSINDECIIWEEEAEELNKNGDNSSNNDNNNAYNYSVGVVLTSECNELSSLVEVCDIINEKVSKQQKEKGNRYYQLNLGLNLSSNALDDDAIAAASPFLRRLQYLAIGGNPIKTMSSITSTIDFTMAGRQTLENGDFDVINNKNDENNNNSSISPKINRQLLSQLSCLKVLDLSFTQNLIIDPYCFLSCPLIQRLVLDGCGIKTTIHENILSFKKDKENVDVDIDIDVDGNESDLAELENELPGGTDDAIITKLLLKPIDDTKANIKIKELYKKLKESSIFAGLSELRELCLNDNSIDSYHALCGLAGLSKLKLLCLEENSILIDVTRRNFVEKQLLCSQILKLNDLRFLDGRDLQYTGVTIVEKTPGNNNLGSCMGKEWTKADQDMEDEVQMSLRGEKDVTVIA